MDFTAPPHAGFLAPFFSSLIFCSLVICQSNAMTSSALHTDSTQLHRLKPLSPDRRSPMQFSTSTRKRKSVTMPTILYVTVAAKQSHITAKEYSVLQIINKQPRPECELILNRSDYFHTQSDNALKNYLTRSL